MAKNKTSFFCQNCGTQHAKWMGQCTVCGEWNTIVEEVVQKEVQRAWKQSTSVKGVSKPLKINEIVLNPEERISTNNSELDPVLGGGLVRGSVTLLVANQYWEIILLLQIALLFHKSVVCLR